MATRLPIPPALWVYGPDGLIGTLHNSDPLSFSYSEEWLRKSGAEAIHPDVPLQAGTIDTPYIGAFFENLLPEGEQRTVIGLREQVSTVFGILARIGGESAGAYTLLPEGETPQPPVYQPLSWEQVKVLVHADGTRPQRTHHGGAAGFQNHVDLDQTRQPLPGARA